MKYLDYSNMPAILEQFFNGPGMRSQRLVGREGLYDSGYYDIVRFFGEGAIKPSHIRIEYLSRTFSFSDSRIREFSKQVERRLRDQGKVHEGPTVMKLAGFDRENYPPTMYLQECAYGDHAGSCLALDLPHPIFDSWGGNLRWYYKTVYPSTDVERNPLAICLGICAYLMATDGGGRYLLQVRRTSRLASLESSLSPSVAGTVDFTRGYRDLTELIKSSLSEEVQEELNLSVQDYDIVPLAYAREIFRGERPQLFCLMLSKRDRNSVAEALSAIDPSSREFDGFEFVKIDDDRPALDKWLATVNHEARMNYYLIEEYS
jgi:8-oxo-dGTP pyrophosphatase MutT (NUDIX family)